MQQVFLRHALWCIIRTTDYRPMTAESFFKEISLSGSYGLSRPETNRIRALVQGPGPRQTIITIDNLDFFSSGN
jgi:hypothetical protein